MNRGLSPKLKALFPKTVSVDRNSIGFNDLAKNNISSCKSKYNLLNPFWVVGFTDAEGNFYIGIYKKTYLDFGFVRLVFSITQHIRDKNLLQDFLLFFNCGNYTLRNNQLAGDFKVTSFIDIYQKIIPFFLKYPLISYKSLSFYNFCLVAKIIKEKRHLTKQGIVEIENIIKKK